MVQVVKVPYPTPTLLPQHFCILLQNPEGLQYRAGVVRVKM